jgi:protein disulfide-isomerase
MSSTMRPVLVVGLIALGVAAVVGVSEWRDAHVREIIPWRTDLSAARAEAAAQHKPLLVYFTATWCGPCQKMKKTTWADNDVKAAMERYVPVKIDVDAQKAIAGQFRIEAMPTYVVVNEAGDEVRRDVGGVYPEQMVAWLKR